MADKQILAKYVHDAVEMEVSRHTLNGIRDSLDLLRKRQVTQKEYNLMDTERKNKGVLTNHETHYQHFENNYQERIKDKQRQRKYYEQKLNEPIYAEPFHFHFWTWFIMPLSVILMVVFACVVTYLDLWEITQTTIVLSIIPGPLLGLIISYIIQRIIWRSDCKSDKEDQKRKTIECKNKIATLDLEISEEKINHQKEAEQQRQKIERFLATTKDEEDKCRSEIDHAKKIFDELTPHISTMDKQLDTMDSQLSAFYANNLIPPDYRSLECVIAFDQMFRNDLVDTIREAVLLYEERVFRGEMLKGLDKLITHVTKIPTFVAEYPLDCVAVGTGLALDRIKTLMSKSSNR